MRAQNIAAMHAAITPKKNGSGWQRMHKSFTKPAWLDGIEVKAGTQKGVFRL